MEVEWWLVTVRNDSLYLELFLGIRMLFARNRV